MGEANIVQIVVTALLSSGLVGGLITLLSKRVWSPESKNELARIGSEFAQLLLEEARTEREELRMTIVELEASILTKEEAIERLKLMAREKDSVISLLEERQFVVARKIQQGELVSLYDIFGPKTPPEFLLGFTQKKRKEPKDGD